MKTDLPLTIQNITGEKLTFLKIDFKDGIEYLETESEVQPNAGPPMHVHYKQDESLTVVSGKIGYQQPGGEKKYAGVGETVLFKTGTPHKFWNAGNEVLICRDMRALPITWFIFFRRSINQWMKMAAGRACMIVLIYLTGTSQSFA